MTRTNAAHLVLWMSGALLAFSTMALSIRALAGVLNVFEILAIRSATGVVVLATLAALRPSLRKGLVLRRAGLHVVRNCIHFAGQFAWALAITMLPLATAFALEFTTPAWVALFAVILLGERLTPSRAGAVALGLIGVVIILHPGLGTFRPAAFLMLGAAVGFALALVATKKLTTTESTFAILMWMNVLQLPMNLAGSDPLFWLKLDASHLVPVLGVAIAGISSHFCLTNAFRHGDATIVVPLDFLRIPLIAIVGFWFYGEPLDPLVFVGAGCIISGVLWNLRAETARV
jgi:drug/metabolite transporter (DMT)-like permease